MTKKTKNGGPLASLRTSRQAPRQPQYRSGLALTDVIDHLTITQDGTVTAWYVLNPQRWSFLSSTDRNRLIALQATRYGELTGRHIHLRITHRPYPVARWARALDESSYNQLPGWDRYLEEEQVRMARLPLDSKLVYMGVRLARLTALGRAGRRSWRTGRDLKALEGDLRQVDATMAAAGMDARPAGAADMDWLLVRSLGLGLPAPLHRPDRESTVWEAPDLAEFVTDTQWTAEPFGRHLTVQGRRDGKEIERYVSVLTLGPMDLSPIPERASSPWMQRLDRLPFPYELSARFEMRDREEVSKEIRGQLSAISHQMDHYAEHGQRPPHQLRRQEELGHAIDDELREGGFSGLGTRVQGWVRVAISASSTDLLDQRVSTLQKAMTPQLLWQRTPDQYRIGREFVPGEPAGNGAYRRRMPVTTLAGALPSADAIVGDRSGPALGYTSGASRRPVMWHPWRAMEIREAPGLTPVIGTPGAGKSTLSGSIVYNTARMGVPWTVLDPSGPLVQLCSLPELRPYAQHVDLLRAPAGTLNPYAIVPDPAREHFRPEDYARPGLDRQAAEDAAEEAYRQEQTAAESARRTLARTILRGLLPVTLHTPETDRILLLATTRTAADRTVSPYDVLDQLRNVGGGMSEHGEQLAEMLQGAGSSSHGQLIFPRLHGDDDTAFDAHKRLTVLSLRGLSLPGGEKESWTDEEQHAVALMHLAGWYAQRSIYARSRHERKGLLLDETWALSNVSSGRHLLSRTGRDSRKHNVRALYSTQNGSDFVQLGLQNLIDSVFVGRTEGEQAQAEALRLLGLQPNDGYEGVLASLSDFTHGQEQRRGSREFLFGDGEGGLERITVDLNHRPALLDALDTTARRPAHSAPAADGLSLSKEVR